MRSSPWHNGDRFQSEAAWSPTEEEATAAGGATLLLVVGPDGVVGRLQPGTMFVVVVGGMEGVVGALIVVVGNWLGSSGGSSEYDAGKPVLILVINSSTNRDLLILFLIVFLIFLIIILLELESDEYIIRSHYASYFMLHYSLHK